NPVSTGSENALAFAGYGGTHLRHPAGMTESDSQSAPIFREDVMRSRLRAGLATVIGLCAAFGVAQANDDAANPDNYPNWRGQWYRTRGVQGETAKPPGRGQQAPLIPEYQARYEVSLAEQQRGGQDYKPQVKCMRAGMPQMMVGYEPIEIIVTPQATYMW